MKSYLRYAPERSFGVITSPDCNAIYDYTGKLAFTGSIQNVSVWNLRQASPIQSLKYDIPNYPYGEGGEAIVLARCPDKKTIAVGYSTGEVRLFNFQTGQLISTLRGHTSAVLSLAFDMDGTILATGGADSDIILWDLIALNGIARFHEHKDSVTSLVFIELTEKNQKFVVSGSKDTLLKVWDLDTMSCVQTIVGHRSEVWSITISQPKDSDENTLRMYTGCADETIRVFKLKNGTSDETSTTEDAQEIFKLHGLLGRSSGTDRISSLSVNSTGTLLAAQAAGKYIDIYKLRDATEAKKKMKRREKRVKNKATTDEAAGEAAGASDNEGAAVVTESTGEPTVADEIELIHTLRCSSKVRSFAFNPMPTNSSEDSALVSLTCNTLEIYKVPHSADGGPPTKQSVIDLQGHKSDVRGVTLSADGNNLATCSSDAIKVWSARSYTSTGSCPVEGYCLCVAFAPGGRYVLAGFKDGRVEIYDFASGECVFTDSQAHGGHAVWAINVRPDGKGFATGSADKTAKFWNFILNKNGLSAELDRELALPSDVLTVQYNPSKTTAGLFVAVGLLDNTVRVFYEDSLKLFLTLFGHKLPVLCLDVSYDSTILVSGSADKTLKIWGLDFGDCHRSLFAHDDSVTAIKFQPQTHYFFSSGKDGVVKYWDADRFEQILYLPGHKASIWGMAISTDGAHVYSVGQDRTIRVWERTEDLCFIEEEKERLLESQVDKSASTDGNVINYDGAATGAGVTAAIASAESVKSGEQLITAIDLVETELAQEKENERVLESLTTDAEKTRYKKNLAKSVNPLLLGLSPMAYFQRQLKSIKQPDLEPALLVLPFHYVRRLIFLLVSLARSGRELELCCKCAVFLCMAHQQAITSTRDLLPELMSLRTILTSSVHSYRALIGTNVAGFDFMARVQAEEAEEKNALDTLLQTTAGQKKLDVVEALNKLSEIGNKRKKRRVAH